jgi:signal transduction histidine kinase
VQLLLNLIGNALKYRGTSRPKITMTAALKNGEWLFAVRDNGIGIPERYLRRIFEPFQRLHDQREIAGTGIGLATCSRVVQRHGGRIWVESELGRGSVFYFTIPQKVQPA